MFALGQTTSKDDGDVFARHMVVHTSIQESVPITSDIYEQLFDSILVSELFIEWLQCKDHWQLHVVGGPGAGKVSLYLER
jgi:Ni,Fe-hydrogenase III large subunit